jgi:O-antigen ligase
MRVGLARWALEIGRESPIVGSGAGSYGDALEALPAHQEWRATNPRTRRERRRVERTFPADHAHNSILHIFATSGLVGVVLCLLVLGVIVQGALRNFRAIPFGAATPFVVVAWFIGSQFDTFHLSGQLCGLLCLCAFLSVTGPQPAVPPE